MEVGRYSEWEGGKGLLRMTVHTWILGGLNFCSHQKYTSFFSPCVCGKRGWVESKQKNEIKKPNDKAGQLKSFFFDVTKSVSVSGRDGIGIEV